MHPASLQTLPVPPSMLSSVQARIADELRHLLDFIRRPRRRYPIQVSTSHLLCSIVIVLGVNALFAIAIALPVQMGLERWIGLRVSVDTTTLGFFFGAVFMAPLLEELIFRAGLRNATVLWSVQPLLICMMLAQWRIAAALAIIAALVLPVDFYRQWRRHASEQFAVRVKRGRAFLSHYHQIVWAYALVFGLIHLSNFHVGAHAGWLAALAVFAVLPQLFSGLLLSYMRLRYRIFSAMMFHASINGAVLVVELLSR